MQRRLGLTIINLYLVKYQEKQNYFFFPVFLINPSYQFIIPNKKINVHSYSNTPHQRIFGQEITCALTEDLSGKSTMKALG